MKKFPNVKNPLNYSLQSQKSFKMKFIEFLVWSTLCFPSAKDHNIDSGGGINFETFNLKRILPTYILPNSSHPVCSEHDSTTKFIKLKIISSLVEYFRTQDLNNSSGRLQNLMIKLFSCPSMKFFWEVN